MGERGNGILPDELFGGNFRTFVEAAGTHIAVGQLEPSACKGIGEFVGILVETT